MQDEINEMKSEFNEQLMRTFDNKEAPDVCTLIVKQDQEDLFGLSITARHCHKVTRLFDFDIDEYISLKQMLQMCKLPADTLQEWSEEQWRDYLREKSLMEFNIVESDKHCWGELARNMLNSFSQSILVNDDAAMRRTVLLNQTRGNQLYGSESQSATTVTYLFMVNRSTEHIG